MVSGPRSCKDSTTGIGTESSPPMTTGAAPRATTVATAARIALRFAAGSASLQARSPPSTAVTAPGKIGPPMSKSTW
jgi:hypothetical protein